LCLISFSIIFSIYWVFFSDSTDSSDLILYNISNILTFTSSNYYGVTKFSPNCVYIFYKSSLATHSSISLLREFIYFSVYYAKILFFYIISCTDLFASYTSNLISLLFWAIYYYKSISKTLNFCVISFSYSVLLRISY